MPSKSKDDGVVLRSVKVKEFREDSNLESTAVEGNIKSTQGGKVRFGTPLPLASCNFVTFCTVSWLSSLVYQIARTVKESLHDDALWSCAPMDGCQYNGQRLKAIWMKEVETYGMRNASFFRTCAKFLRPLFLKSCLPTIVFAINLAVLTVVVFRYLLRYLREEGQDPYYGYLLAGCIFIANVIQICSFECMFGLAHLFGMRLEGASMYLVYNKILSAENLRKSTVGELVNIFTTDAMRIYMAANRFYTVPMFIFVLIGSVTSTSFLIGWWTLAPVMLFIFMVVFQVISTRFTSKLQKKKLKHTDRRIQRMKEVLSSIRLIKMLAWEVPFVSEIINDRSRETSKAETLTFLTSFGICQFFQAPALATAVTLTLYVYFGNTLTTELAFTVATTIATMRYAFAVLPSYGRHLADFIVSCKRIQALLLSADYEEGTDVVTDNTLAIEMMNSSFQWPTTPGLAASDPPTEGGQKAYNNPVMDGEATLDSEACERPHHNRHYALRNISFTARKGSLIGICGKVGSGKSALVSAVLGELKKSKGSSALNGSVAICPQEAWIFNDTVRENILFGNPFDKEKYERVLELTCFHTDLAALPSSDLSEVGERGITLSGGQRQRLSLARALYSDRDIYILDDPLSALDVTVGQQVFTRCIKEELKHKTVILITHQLQYLQDCDRVVLLEEGIITENGTHRELMSHGGEYAYLINSFYEKNKTKTDEFGGKLEVEGDANRNRISNPDSHAGRLTEKESMELGNVSLSSYMNYIRAMGGGWVFCLLLVSFLLAESVSWGSDWLLSAWLQQKESVQETTNSSSFYNTTFIITTTPSMTDTQHSRVAQVFTGVTSLKFDFDKSAFIMAYGLGVVAIILTNCLRCWALAKTTMESSRVLHKQVLEKVINSPISFFDKTPLGRIINRFSADIDIVDSYLSEEGGILLMVSSRVFIAVISIAAVLPLVLVVLIPIVILVYIVGHYGTASMRQMKRMDHVSRSNLVDHVTSTIQGLDSVRIYGKGSMFKYRMISCMDKKSVRFVLYGNSMDWVLCRIDFIASLFMMLAAVFVVFFRDVIPAQLGGLVLSITVQAMTLVGVLILQTCNVEGLFTSVERLTDYIKHLQLEGSRKKVTASVDADWPRRGDVTFSEVCMSYDTHDTQVLSEVSFTVTSGQKIGIIGRTGAGKTSLGAALFRLAELSSGSILIDGVDISQLTLQQLRSRLSVIPQEPVLFAGSVRRNLDPFHTCTDEEVWVALEKSQLKEKVAGLAGRLEYYVENNGENFSVGERQLLCMARVLLRDAKIILLDEATANVDTETDSKIQQMVREYFTERTVFIIAHRLNTVQHCDKILVMNDGKVHEFDTPESLLKQPHSLYRSMVQGKQ